MRNICIVWLLMVATVSLSGQEGIPFFRNYPSTEYGGHNRNFDVISGKDGMTYFANFEGLLSFDNSTWRMIYAPGYSRITRLFMDAKGVLWTGGYNMTAQLTTDSNGQQILKPIASDSVTVEMGEESPQAGKWGNIDINQTLRLCNGYQVLATQNEGVIILDKNGTKLYSITEANGLCSNNVKRMAEDVNGCIWGVTDNGIFSIYAPSMFSRYTALENLKGEVTCIQRHRQQLYIGTLQGLYMAEGNTVLRISSITQACWQLLPAANGKLYAATSNGIFEIENGKARQLTRSYALSLACETAGILYVGEMDGIYRLFLQGRNVTYEKISPFDKIVQFTWDGSGGLTARDLLGNVYYKPGGRERFIAKGSQPADNRVSYHWGKTEWHTDTEGKNITMTSSQQLKNRIEKQNQSLASLKDKTIRTIYAESDSLLWLGGDFGAIRIDFSEKDAAFDHLPQLFIREVIQDVDTLRFGGDYLKEITFHCSTDAMPVNRNIEYQYILEGYDTNWSSWTEQAKKSYINLDCGNYTFKVRAKDSFGRYSPVKEYSFDIPWPFYLKWYSIIFYVLLLVLFIYWIIRQRLRKLVEEKENLERIVASRTRRIMEQKNEIEEKSNNLENALHELRQTQSELVRQEKMATVGKLTKGLIDRILNPLNYINNFSHLSSGLVGDLRHNLQTVETGMDRESYEESMDILDMMASNLSKIEEHGGNTSRVLKAMEEVLRERSRQKQRMDVIALCRQSLDMLAEYYKEDIDRMQVVLKADFPVDTLMIQGNEEQLGKTLMSLLNNGMYALSRKYNKQAYPPEIGISIECGEGIVSISLKDNGIGMEESIQEQVFDPFFTTKTTAEAAGVGLYLSKEIITNHGGNIHVHSRQGEYTEFIIKLPIE